MKNKFSLTLDDFSPRPHTNDLYWCNKLIEKYPGVKIDLFVPAAYARLSDKTPYLLSENLDWVEQAKQLPGNYRLNLHGFFHRRTKRDWKHHKGPDSNNNEWGRLSYDQAAYWLKQIESEFEKVGLGYYKVFRAPGWHLSKGAVRLLGDRGYIIAGDDKYYRKYKSELNTKWVSYNWDMTSKPPNKNNIVAFGHTSDWTNNYMDEERYRIIKNFLNKNDTEFKFIGEM